MMNEILHANIFFVIASIATVLFCILISVILYQVLKITKSLRAIVEKIEAGSEMIVEDITRFRSTIAEGGMFSRLFQFIMGVRGATRKKRSRSKD